MSASAFLYSSNLSIDLQKAIMKECPNRSKSHSVWLKYLDKMESKVREMNLGESANQIMLKLYEDACSWLPELWTDETSLIITMRRAALLLYHDIESGLALMSLCSLNARRNPRLAVAVAFHYSRAGERSRAKTVLATAKKQANSVDHALLCGAEMLLESGGDWKTVLGALYYEPPYDGGGLKPPDSVIDTSQIAVNKPKKSSIQSEEKMVHFAQDLSTTIPNAELSSVSSLSESPFGSLSNSKVTEPTESVLGSDSGVSETPTPFTASVTDGTDVSTVRQYHDQSVNASQSKMGNSAMDICPSGLYHSSSLPPFHTSPSRPGRAPLRTIDLPPHLPCFKGTGESTSVVIERSRFLPSGQENVTRSASFTEPSKREFAAASDSASANPFLASRSDFGRSTLGEVSHSIQSTVPPLNQLSVGHLRVNGKPYWILGEIGRGGSSVVYSALDSDQNLWALKDVNLRGASKELADSYLNEVDMLLTLRDTGRVIRLHDHEQTPTNLYLILELASVDLKDVFMELFEVTDSLPDNCPMAKLSPLAVAFYWDQMLRCVKVLHDKRIVHLDLKPQNFVLVRGKLKLIDLGVSQRLPDDCTRVNPALQLGTLTYMSPEQLDIPTPSSSCRSSCNPNMAAEERFRIGRKSDIWALGVMLYLMVYSRSPFPQPTMQGRLLAIINPAVAIEFPPIENQGIYKALQRSLVRDYKDRASVEELLSIKYGS